MKELYRAKFFHKRFFPKKNEFCYSGFYIKFSVDKLEDLKNPLFSVNRFNLFSFHEKDHGYRDNRSLRSWAQATLAEAGISDFKGEIILQTYPSVLGHVFNPVSFWYCYDETNTNQLVAVICAVNNTFGESHNYVIQKDLANYKTKLDKEFHVSPFYDVEGTYEFNFKKRNFVGINYFFDGKLQLATYVNGSKLEWKTSNFLKLFLRYPLYSFMVLGLIHYQALKLFLKKMKFYTKPEKIKRDVTFEHSIKGE